MAAINTFFGLKGTLQKLLLETWGRMILVRLKLWILSFERLQKSFEKEKVANPHHYNIKTMVWAVHAVSPYVPRATCLTQAITAHQLFSKYGYSSLVKIGVGKDETGEFEAHAWLEHEDKVVLGESEKEYVPLMDLKKSN